MNETLRKLHKARQAAGIARDFAALAQQHPAAALHVAYDWQAIGRLAKRLELMPDTLATILVNESTTCHVATDADPTSVAAPRVRRTQ